MGRVTATKIKTGTDSSVTTKVLTAFLLTSLVLITASFWNNMIMNFSINELDVNMLEDQRIFNNGMPYENEMMMGEAGMGSMYDEQMMMDQMEQQMMEEQMMAESAMSPVEEESMGIWDTIVNFFDSFGFSGGAVTEEPTYTEVMPDDNIMLDSMAPQSGGTGLFSEGGEEGGTEGSLMFEVDFCNENARGSCSDLGKVVGEQWCENDRIFGCSRMMDEYGNNHDCVIGIDDCQTSNQFCQEDRFAGYGSWDGNISRKICGPCVVGAGHCPSGFVCSTNLSDGGSTFCSITDIATLKATGKLDIVMDMTDKSAGWLESLARKAMNTYIDGVPLWHFGGTFNVNSSGQVTYEFPVWQ